MPLIVGETEDVHVQAVVAALDVEPTVLNASSFLTTPVTVAADGLRVGGEPLAATRGWLRRLAPAGWTETMNGPGRVAAGHSAAMSALAAVARDPRIDWLTRLDALGGAENKPVQYRAAALAGVPVPDWVVTTDPDDVPRAGSWVSKPLGPGSFIDDDGNGWVVPTARADLRNPATITAVPFVLQRLVEATAHARVVTVGDRVWSAVLPAGELPLDWRLSPQAHGGFTSEPVPGFVLGHARAAAATNGVRYSAQDWIRDSNHRWWFIDLNPAGQWLFLPEPIASGVTGAIADFLQTLP
jgi:hypothetical protein